MDDTELLHNLYHTNKNYVGVEELYRIAKIQHPSIKKPFVKDWLLKQQAYQLNTRDDIAKKKEYLPIYTETPYSFQVDLTFFPKYKKQNDNYYVLFTAININTRFAYAYYGKDKSMKTIMDMLKQMEQKAVINAIYCDEGTEFNNKEFLTFVKIKYINNIY